MPFTLPLPVVGPAIGAFVRPAPLPWPEPLGLGNMMPTSPVALASGAVNGRELGHGQGESYAGPAGFSLHSW